MLDKIQKFWKEVMFIVIVAGVAFQFYDMKTEAKEAKEEVTEVKEKTKQYDKAFEDIAQIAQELADPNKPLRDFLTLRGIHKEVARDWASKPKGPVVDSLGNELPLSFLDPKLLPEIGVEMKPADSGYRVIDTLWNFKHE